MVHTQGLDLVKWKQDTDEKHLVLFLKGQGKAIDDAAEDLQELGNPIVMFSLINEPVEDVVDLPTNICPQPQKLAVDTMQNGLEKIPLSRVLAIK